MSTWSPTEPPTSTPVVCCYCGHGVTWPCDCAGKRRGHRYKGDGESAVCIERLTSPLHSIPQPNRTKLYAHPSCQARTNGICSQCHRARPCALHPVPEVQ